MIIMVILTGVCLNAMIILHNIRMTRLTRRINKELRERREINAALNQLIIGLSELIGELLIKFYGKEVGIKS
ncbi:MAG: hypothetical protein HYV47_03815 [Candidatus Nealsonbacteria bacterium]|nr:hypothetical protein [Candidatus Nealsonbacteria bacterium]